MGQLYFSRCERRDFGELLSRDRVTEAFLESAENLERVSWQLLSAQTVVAIWSDSSRRAGLFPELLVCADDTEADWAAWITTFAARLRPFSAHARLISAGALEKVLASSKLPFLDRATWPVAGLVLGEVLAASGQSDKTLEETSAATVAGTLSFALCRAAALYRDFDQWEAVSSAWDTVRKLTRQRPRAIDSRAIAKICSTVVGAAESGSRNAWLGGSLGMVGDACQELMSGGETVPSSLMGVEGFGAVERQMHGSREDRVLAFEEYVRRMAVVDGGQEIGAFMLGYLASRIAPGTMRHASVLAPAIRRYPTSLLWYGFCAGVGSPDGERIRTSTNRTKVDLPESARRVVRELLRGESLEERPQCDISLQELIALSRTGDTIATDIVRTTASVVNVELMPGVCTMVPVPSTVGASTKHSRGGEDKEIVARIGECLERLMEVYERLGGGKESDNEGGQGTLFSGRRRRR